MVWLAQRPYDLAKLKALQQNENCEQWLNSQNQQAGTPAASHSDRMLS